MAIKHPASKPRVLFVCLGNAVRSQMAEALARHSANDVATYASAGLTPLGAIAPLTQRVLAERGVSSDGHYSKSLAQASHTTVNIVINMSGEPRASHFRECKAEIEDWLVDDPYGAEIEEYRRACDAIEVRVAEFTARLRRRTAAPPARAGGRKEAGTRTVKN
jgi:arsenate reductase (thioredoxin)